MRVMMTGSRHHTNKELIDLMLTQLHEETPIELLIVGDAKGADAIATRWAEEHYVDVVIFIADWNEYGRGAGPRRNQEMIDYQPDLVLAFPLHGSRGTQDAMRRAHNAGIEVKCYGPLYYE